MTLKEIRSYIESELRRKAIPLNYTKDDLNLRINHAMDSLSEDVGGFRGMASKNTVVNIERYKLPSEMISLDRVEFNGEQISRVRTDALTTFTVNPLLLNGNFESMEDSGSNLFEHWVSVAGSGVVAKTTSSTYVYSGTVSLALQYSSGESHVYQDIVVTPHTHYRLRMWGRVLTSVTGQYRVYDNTNAADITAKSNTALNSTTYAKLDHTFMTPKDCVSIRVYLYSPATSDIAYYDEVSLTVLAGKWALTNETGS